MKTDEEVVELIKDSIHSVTGNFKDFYQNNDEFINDFLKSKGLIKEFEVGYYGSKLSKDYCMYWDSEKTARYGINRVGKWVDGICNVGFHDKLFLLGKEEVEEAIKKEAIKRGFKKGVKVKCLSCVTDTSRIMEGYTPEYDLDELGGFWNYNMCIMKDGKWATIVEEKEEKECFCFSFDYSKLPSRSGAFSGTFTNEHKDVEEIKPEPTITEQIEDVLLKYKLINRIKK